MINKAFLQFSQKRVMDLLTKFLFFVSSKQALNPFLPLLRYLDKFREDYWISIDQKSDKNMARRLYYVKLEGNNRVSHVEPSITHQKKWKRYKKILFFLSIFAIYFVINMSLIIWK